MDDVSYGALALALTLVGGTYTWFAYQRRGLGAGLKGAGLTLLPIAAYLTRTLRMLAEVADAIGDWATRLVLSPVVWTGVALGAVAVVLYAAGRVVEARGGGAPAKAPKQRGPEQLPGSPAPASPAGRAPAAADDEFADIEALLKNRGIT